MQRIPGKYLGGSETLTDRGRAADPIPSRLIPSKATLAEDGKPGYRSDPGL